MLRELLKDAATDVAVALEDVAPRLHVQQIGTVMDVGGGVAHIRGLPDLKAEELVRLPDGLMGIATDLDPQVIGVVLLGDSQRLIAGAEAHATGRLIDTPVGEALLGRVVDATGRALDGKGVIAATERWPIEREVPAIMHRAPVSTPLQSGLKVVDALIPIGRGQRELIIGDRQTGKTSIAVDAILNQRGAGVVCVYCAIGQRATAVARVVETLRHHAALEYTIVVVAAGEDAAGLQFITPYAATSMAEYFMEQGRDVLIVYDDLTRHARVYRELSLLLRRPPGREAYPGDIFYIHSRLLERAAHLREEQGGGSLTALPIVETQAQEISSYIPTNLISITDGQIYLSPDLFRKGMLPAVDVGKSVSRVGGKAQRPGYRAVAADLRLAYAQFEELETFARFSTRLDEDTRASIERGRRVREALKQPEGIPIPIADQLLVLKAVTDGLFDALPVEKLTRGERLIVEAMQEQRPELRERLESGARLDDSQWQALLEVARTALTSLQNE